ncbi:hypothetical protein FQN52_004395 [Onygenales sp. PD_12]|nr:hypothetical protein FQN52_004395 [Onygenales sp. PD_12]
MISYSLPWSRETPSHESTTFKDHFKQNAISLIFRNQLLILKIQTFEDHFKVTESSVADPQNKIKSAEHCISDVEGSVADLKDVRNRFISTYKRDVLGIETEADKVMIRRGNRFVHGGDCKRDADLYEAPAQRQDFSVYMKLYGLQPGTVRFSICGCWAMVIIELPHNLNTMLQIMARLHCLGQLREVFVWALTVNHSFHWYWAGNFTKKVISNPSVQLGGQVGGQVDGLTNQVVEILKVLMNREEDLNLKHIVQLLSSSIDMLLLSLTRRSSFRSMLQLHIGPFFSPAPSSLDGFNRDIAVFFGVDHLPVPSKFVDMTVYNFTSLALLLQTPFLTLYIPQIYTLRL